MNKREPETTKILFKHLYIPNPDFYPGKRFFSFVQMKRECPALFTEYTLEDLIMVTPRITPYVHMFIPKNSDQLTANEEEGITCFFERIFPLDCS